MVDGKVYSLIPDNFFARIDYGNAIYFYSSLNGLIYAVSFDSLSETQRCLIDANANEQQFKEFFKQFDFSEQRLLPLITDWSTPKPLHYPLTINWLITNRCTQNCRYCYAYDVMTDQKFDNIMNYEMTINHISALSPLNVVLSGGEPFLNKDIGTIIQLLSGKAGILIDTNGICFETIRSLASILVDNKVVIRLSLDTMILKDESYLRPSTTKSNSSEDFNKVTQTIEILKAHGISFSIQTVLTKKNCNDLESMGDKLFKIGISVWKIIPVQEAAQKESEISKLKMDEKKSEYFIKKLKHKAYTHWKGMQVIDTKAKRVLNDVVLVLPNGEFYTEGGYKTGKKVIDAYNPCMPTIESLNNRVDLREHFRRYLNPEDM